VAFPTHLPPYLFRGAHDLEIGTCSYACFIPYYAHSSKSELQRTLWFYGNKIHSYKKHSHYLLSIGNIRYHTAQA
jgi:hypothetical protein